MKKFYAVETVREIAKDDRHDEIFDHVPGEVLFEAERVDIFKSKAERDAFVEKYNQPIGVCVGGDDAISEHVWTCRAVKSDEARRIIKSNPYMHDGCH